MLPYCWRDETPLSTHELRMDDDVYKMRQDPSVTVTFPLTGRQGRGARPDRRARARVDDDAVDASDEPRARRRARTSAMSSSRAARRAPPTCTRARRPQRRHAEANRTATCSPRSCCRTTRRTSATRSADAARDAVEQRILGAELAGRHLRPALRLLRGCRDLGHRNGLAHPRRRLRHDRRRHRHRPPGAGIRRGRPAGHRGRRHPAHHEPGRRRTVPPAGDGCRRRAVDGREHAARAHPAPGRAPAAPRELRALVPALLALPQSADLQGGLELVRARHRRSRTA